MLRSLLMLLFGLGLTGELSATPAPLRVLLTDYPPLIDLAKHDKGPHGKLILTALDDIGQEYTLEEYSWSRIKKMLNERDVCSFGWLKLVERTKRWRYSKPYATEVSYLYGRKDNALELRTLQDVKKYRVGVTRTYSYGQALDAVFSTMETDESSTDEANIRKLLAGRIDLYATEHSMMESLLDLFYPDSKHLLEPKFKVGNLDHHFVCNLHYAQGQDVIEKLDRYFAALR